MSHHFFDILKSYIQRYILNSRDGYLEDEKFTKTKKERKHVSQPINYRKKQDFL